MAIKFIIHNQKKIKTNKLLLKDEKVAKEKMKKEHQFYQKEDEKLNQSIQQDLNKKELVSAWIKDNKSEYDKLLEEMKEAYLVRAYVQREVLNI